MKKKTKKKSGIKVYSDTYEIWIFKIYMKKNDANTHTYTEQQHMWKECKWQKYHEENRKIAMKRIEKNENIDSDIGNLTTANEKM